jgi:cobalt-zinc-cadmium efflux system protein
MPVEPRHEHESGSHAGHAHAVTADTNRRRLALALALIVAFMTGEVVVGILANSLALLSDAAHMLTDAGAIGLSLIALALAARPAGGNLTFGFKRAEILSAQANGATLVVLAGLILYEAIRRLVEPLDVHGWAVLGVALAGIVVNVVATWLLAAASSTSSPTSTRSSAPRSPPSSSSRPASSVPTRSRRSSWRR